MFDNIKNLIKTKGFELKDMLKKINIVWLESMITDEQMKELKELARENAKTDNSIGILQKLKELDERVMKLENKSVEESPSKPVKEEYPDFVKDKWYYNGDKITYNGKKYICIAPEGQVCVWSPDDYGTYWQEVVEENTDETDETENNIEESEVEE